MTDNAPQTTATTEKLTATEREMLDAARHYVGYDATDEIVYAAVERILAGRTPKIQADAIREAARRHARLFEHTTENKLTRAWLRDQADVIENN